VLDKLIESLIVNKSINPETLLMGDKNAIVIAARIGAYGPGYDVALICPACGAKNTAAIDLNEAKVKDADAIIAKIAEDKSLEFVRYNNGNIVLELPKTKWLVECKLITGADEKRLLTYLEKKRVKDANAEISISEQLALIIVSVNLASDNETVMTAINNMPASDAKFLRDSYQKLVPNVVIGKRLTCSSCLEEQDLEVPFTQEFFWPR
jgi:UDP-N-acetylglucosamine pyrophosphorylase